jgi:hypothetical protein
MAVMHRLQDLPHHILVHILRFLFLEAPALILPLLAASRTLFNAALSVLYSDIVLPDDDRILLLAAGELGEEAPLKRQRRGKCLLSNIVCDEDYAAAVASLRLISPATLSADAAFASERSPISRIYRNRGRALEKEHAPAVTEEPSESTVPPLDGNALSDLISRLKNLDRLDIRLARPAPRDLGRTMAHLPRLRTLSVGIEQPGSPGQSSPSTSSPGLPLETNQYDHERPVRWDGNWLPLLSNNLSILSLSHLSLEGIKSLTRSLPNLHHLQQLTIGHTPYVDDSLMSALAEQCRRLRRLVVRNMSGTRLTDKGIKQLLENAEALSELDLIEFEGRLSRRCWEKIEKVPPTFRSLRMSYAEAGSHHSFVFVRSISVF